MTAGHCGAGSIPCRATPAQLYPCGWRCTSHAPTTEPKESPVTEPLSVALAAARRGWHVFPLRLDDKRPAVARWEQRATTDEHRIERCWNSGPYGIGIACGPSALVVVDLDEPKDDQLPPSGAETFAALAEPHGNVDTYTVRTGRGGTHLYFRHPEDGPELRNTAGALGQLIDTRAHGGYVVAAGSTVAGNLYLATDPREVEPLPGWLADALRPTPMPAQRPVVVELPTDRRGAYVRAAIDAEVRRVAEAPEGRRNRSLYIAAVALGQLVAGGELSTVEAEAVLEHAGVGVGLRYLETVRTIASGLRAGGKRPRTVAA